MFVLSWIKFFRGYVYVHLTGYATERFLNLCGSRNIFNLEFKTNGRWVLFLYQRGWLPQFKANLKKNKDKGAHFKKIRCAVSTVPLPET